MGSIVSSPMKDAMKNNQRDMLELQIQMQNQMRIRQAAMQMGRLRDTFHWFLAFYCTITPLLLIGALKRRNPGLFLPTIPLTFVAAYQVSKVFIHINTVI